MHIRPGWWTSYGTKGFSPLDKLNASRNRVSNLIAKGNFETGFFKAQETQKMANKMIEHAKKNTNGQDLKIRQYVRTQIPEVIPNLYKLATKYASVEGNYTRLHKIGYSQFDKSPIAYLEFVGTERNLEFELVLREAARRLIDANDAASGSSTSPQQTKRTAGTEAQLQKKIARVCELRGMTVDEFQEEVVKCSKDERFLNYLRETKEELKAPLPHIRDNPLLSVLDRNPQHTYRIRDAITKWKEEKRKEKNYEVVPRKVVEDMDVNITEEVKDWYQWDPREIHKRLCADGGGWGKRKVEMEQYYKTKIAEGTLTYEDLDALRRIKSLNRKNKLPKPEKKYKVKARREGFF